MSVSIPMPGLLRKLLLKRRAARIAASPLFDAGWYLHRYPDVKDSGLDAAMHYLHLGAAEDRRPNVLFDPDWFDPLSESRSRRPTPLEQYLALPVDKRPSTHPLVDPDWYRQRHSDRLGREHDVLEHFLVNGAADRLSTHPEFDSAWYVARYPDIRDAGINPLCHYLEFGATEGRDPNPYFDTEWYEAQYLDGDRDGLNPLVHYVRFGKKAGLPSKPSPQRERWWDRFSAPDGIGHGQPVSSNFAWHALERRYRECAGITVIVAVHNAPAAVDECLRSVATCTPVSVPVLVIDDASTDPEIDKILGDFAGNDQFRVERNEAKVGYTGTINRGLDLAGDHDVVLLNSDTVVGPGWLTRLVVAAYREDLIGTVSAVSNNAFAFSVPVTNEVNKLPTGVNVEKYARAIAQTAWGIYPETPTGNGVCMYIRRRCILESGPFDEHAFPGGGEENDFCRRARKLGWKHIVDDSTFVAHERAASYGAERETPVVQGLALAQINARYPGYGELVREFFESDTLGAARERVRQINAIFGEAQPLVRPRVLFVLAALHEAGGTSHTSQDLMTALEGSVETFLLRSDGQLVELYDCRGSERVLLDYRVLSEPIRAFPHRSTEYDAIVAQWMFDYAIELVHVRHIALHGLGLIDVARGLMLPVVFSFHDYYAVCPTNKLLDERLVFCGGKCTPSLGKCTPELWPDIQVPQLKHAAVKPWKEMFASALAKCDAFVSTSEAAREIIRENFPELARKPFELIRHGRDFARFGSCAAELDPESRLRILVPGSITSAKGARIVAELASRAGAQGLEIHVLGSMLCDEQVDGIIEHGAYYREDFMARAEEIRPHLGAVLSIWPETWCHTLTELWAAGVPAVGFDFGAIRERIHAHGGGWVLPAATPEAFETLISELRREPNEHAKRISAVRGWQKFARKRQSSALMACQYLALYSLHNSAFKA